MEFSLYIGIPGQQKGESLASLGFAFWFEEENLMISHWPELCHKPASGSKVEWEAILTF